MRLLISGSSGFVGKALVSYFSERGHEIRKFVRSHPRAPDELTWESPLSHFERLEAVIHLAGEPLSLCRWTRKKKERIFSSRVEGTKKLCALLSSLSFPPTRFFCASAMGFFGHRGEEILDETSPPGKGFLPVVCQEWEAASRSLEERGVRVLRTRFGLVMGPGGGVLHKVVWLYKLGLGATLGSGQQWWSWISLSDLCRAMECVLSLDLTGSIHFTSPSPVRQEEFSKTLARLLHRPAFWKIPAWSVRLLFGEAGEEMLLASARAIPTRLLKTGFSFPDPSLESALRKSLDRI